MTGDIQKDEMSWAERQLIRLLSEKDRLRVLLFKAEQIIKANKEDFHNNTCCKTRESCLCEVTSYDSWLKELSNLLAEI